MKLFLRSIKYRLKQNFTTAGSLVMLVIALAAAVYPLTNIKNEPQSQAALCPSAGWTRTTAIIRKQLLKAVGELELLDTRPGELGSLLEELRAGRLEAVYVVNEGFEEKITAGEYEDTLTMYKSPYSSVAGVVSEGVGAQVMHLWPCKVQL